MKNIHKHYSILISISVVMAGTVWGTIHVYFAFLKSLVSVLYSEIQQFQTFQTISHIPAPWATLLFGMGFLGIICVGLDERKKTATHLGKNDTMPSKGATG